MQIVELKVHNFRSLSDCTLHLGDYSLLIGANNSGKTNLMDAIRVFYEKGIKFEENRDFPKFPTDDDESWIEIEFQLTKEENDNLKEDYHRPKGRLRVKKFLKTEVKGSDGKAKLGIYGYVGEELADEHFYGAKNVQQGKLGEIIFIPAASKLDEHTKLSGPSALRELVNEILKKLVKSSEAFSKLTVNFESFVDDFKIEETDEQRSLAGLEKDINEDIQDWDAEFSLLINPINETDIVKNLISVKITDTVLDEKLDADAFGQGFQRHLIFTLIRTAAKYQSVAPPSSKKEFSPDLTMLLFEEPEAYLHPTQQDVMCRSLRTIGMLEGSQVLVSSHSSNFVSQNSNDLPSIIRIGRNEGISGFGQLTEELLASIFEENLKINELVKGTKYEAHADDWKEDMETLKYFLWLNPERCGLFFADQVLCVEGPTERVLINYLFDCGEIEMPKGGVFVLECMGKFNIHRFMNLLGPLKIWHSVLLDDDGNEPPHDKIQSLIEDSKNPYTRKIELIPQNLETFLEIGPAGKPHRKPQHLMLQLKEEKIETAKLEAFKDLVKQVINF